MEPSEGTHPDPFGAGLAATGQKIAELTAVAAIVGQAVAQHRMRKAAQEAAGNGENNSGDEEGSRLAEDRALWAPVLDRGWRQDADLLDTVRAWGAAGRWENGDPGAAEAVGLAEERLREIHPYAMARYDERRAAGMSRTDAMMASVTDFALHPSPRPAPADTRQGRYLAEAGTPGPDPAPGITDADLPAVRRLMDFIARLNARSVAAGQGPLSPDLAETALRNQVDGASDALVSRVIQGLRAGTVPFTSAPQSPQPQTVSAAGPGAVSWPGTVQDAVTATALRRAASGARRPRGRVVKNSTQANVRKPHGPVT